MHTYSPTVYLCLMFFYHLMYKSNGYDPFESSLPGIPCFKPRPITGCRGTLMDAYPPPVPFADDNEPDTKMLLFTPRNPVYPEYLHDCGGRLPVNTYFNESRRTAIVVHGWIDATCRSAWMREYKDQFIQRGDYNIILIDWTWGNGPDFGPAAANVILVGYQIAFLIKNIMKQKNVPAKSFHLMGHSLGSHVCGFAGQQVPGLGRITGIDPASAPYLNAPPEERLDPTDAQLVDIIHTDGGSCAYQGSSYGDPLGHADFYVNGGSVQYSCFPYIIISLLKLDLAYAVQSLLPVACYHYQSLQYFKASINPCECQFVGVECRSYEDFKSGRCRSCGPDGSRCAVMGLDFENYPYKTDGKIHTYYLDTKLMCPYCDNSNIKLGGLQPRNQSSRYCSNILKNNKLPLEGNLLNG